MTHREQPAYTPTSSSTCLLQLRSMAAWRWNRNSACRSWPGGYSNERNWVFWCEWGSGSSLQMQRVQVGVFWDHVFSVRLLFCWRQHKLLNVSVSEIVFPLSWSFKVEAAQPCSAVQSAVWSCRLPDVFVSVCIKCAHYASSEELYVFTEGKLGVTSHRKQVFRLRDI